MYHDKNGGHHWHRECQQITSKISRTTKEQLCNSVKFTQLHHPEIGKCCNCGRYDLKCNFKPNNKRIHKSCNSIAFKNYAKMKTYKTDTCAFTGLPFGSNSEMKPVGDHDHDTLKYRGHIWSAANRLEGALKFIMNETGCTIEEVFEMAKNYLAKPGIDIGLEPYPQLGYETADEALEAFSTKVQAA